jgi:hypothetical protein
MLPHNDEAGEIEAVLAKYRAPAILLHRPYPPTKAPPVRSKLGGLPTLPAAIEWPGGRNLNNEDVPLHFLAQIDCAELPAIEPRLPTEGLLLFFARDDAYQVWGEGPPHDQARVIFVPSVADDHPPRTPPHDLRPIGDRIAENHPFLPDWLLPNETGPVLHFSWPIVAFQFDSWPDASALSDSMGPNYQVRVEALRTASFLTATGLPAPSELAFDLDEDLRRMLSVLKFQSGNTRFPQVGIMIDRVARRVIRSRWQRDAQENRVKDVRSQALHWIKRAAEIGLDAAPSEYDVAKFRSWVDELASDQLPPSDLPRAMPKTVSKALLDSIAILLR